MSNELRAARERLRNSNGCAHWEGADMLTVCNADLAEHPADEDTKLTLEEAEKEFGARGHIDATVSSHRSVVAVKIDDWILLETREDLRTLLSILPPF